ncbi:Os12g0484150 [Oryza sativa Japonica Group]|uniref:Os12g0484150 protein n=1 Tax=Oryza sativa subsp. japonica TaxID=39947 RepID=A0A0N7KU16_ORYSJ|nr:hypothetical protein DAI22_12g129600 [Oryza sativa Japonica Group]BAT17162.1 Os12g0484150 [Oryza sativa Japonica Group]
MAEMLTRCLRSPRSMSRRLAIVASPPAHLRHPRESPTAQGRGQMANGVAAWCTRRGTRREGEEFTREAAQLVCNWRGARGGFIIGGARSNEMRIAMRLCLCVVDGAPPRQVPVLVVLLG